MKVLYDRSVKVAGISIVPFSRLGPERWFDNYAVASYYGWDITDLPDTPKLYSLSRTDGRNEDMSEMSTTSLLQQPGFKSILINDLKGYDIHTYKAVAVSDELKALPVRFNGVDPALRSSVENKVEFRQMFSGRIRMPRYEIVEYRDLKNGNVSFSNLLRGRDAFVLQDEVLSDGKGTFVVRNESDFHAALDVLAGLRAGSRAVISDLIENKHERSVQCSVTRYGVFVGPLQKQIIADPILANLRVPGGAKFCGAEISEHDQFAAARDEIVNYAHIIGETLRDRGYKGIFGIDCLVDDAGSAYVIEVNPRLTGVTPLLTMLWEEGNIPFYLLHILELAGIDYTIEEQASEVPFRDGSLVMLHSHFDTAKVLTGLPESGLYDESAKLKLRKAHLDTGDEGMLWQQYVPVGTVVKPGGRLLAAFTNGTVLDRNDALSVPAAMAITNMRDTIGTIDEVQDEI